VSSAERRSLSFDCSFIAIRDLLVLLVGVKIRGALPLPSIDAPSCTMRLLLTE
jgi:hypothetical protein